MVQSGAMGLKRRSVCGRFVAQSGAVGWWRRAVQRVGGAERYSGLVAKSGAMGWWRRAERWVCDAEQCAVGLRSRADQWVPGGACARQAIGLRQRACWSGDSL